MKERPIIMQVSNVRMILQGLKTNTRRVIKPQPPASATDVFYWWHGDIAKDQCASSGCYYWYPRGLAAIDCPYGEPGDRLWVREPWGAVWPDMDPVPLEECKIEYRADLPAGCTDYPGGWPVEIGRGNDDAPKWRSSMFMPRWASRITLEILDIRVEKVQQISYADALAEGVWRPGPDANPDQVDREYDARFEFRSLWDEINAERGWGWTVNPWVWVIAFKRI